MMNFKLTEICGLKDQYYGSSSTSWEGSMGINDATESDWNKASQGFLRTSRDAAAAEHSDGTTASYYEIPPGTKQLQDLISYKNMNAQMGEMFRATYRYGEVAHSKKLRDINKILFYAEAEKRRLILWGEE